MNDVYPKVYKKAIKGAVGGVFLNKRGLTEEFLLKGDPNTADIERITVEIYDKESERFFMKYNKATVTNGFLIEIGGIVDIVVDGVNSVGDGYLRDLLKQPFTKMRKRCLEFTSSVPVHRLLAIAIETNKPIKTIEFLKKLANGLDERELPSTFTIDGAKVGGIGS